MMTERDTKVRAPQMIAAIRPVQCWALSLAVIVANQLGNFHRTPGHIDNLFCLRLNQRGDQKENDGCVFHFISIKTILRSDNR